MQVQLIHSLQLTLVLLLVIKPVIIDHVQNKVIVDLKQRNELIMEDIDHSESEFLSELIIFIGRSLKPPERCSEQ